MKLKAILVGIVVLSLSAFVSLEASACKSGQVLIDTACVYTGNPNQAPASAVTAREFQMECLMVTGPGGHSSMVPTCVERQDGPLCPATRCVEDPNIREAECCERI